MYLGWQGMAQTSSDPSKHIGQHLNLSSHSCHRVVSTQRMLAHAQTASCKPPDGSGCFPREPLGHEAVMPGASRHDCCDDCYGLIIIIGNSWLVLNCSWKLRNPCGDQKTYASPSKCTATSSGTWLQRRLLPLTLFFIHLTANKRSPHPHPP